MKKLIILLFSVMILLYSSQAVFASAEEKASIIIYVNEDFDTNAFRKENLCEITREFSEVVRGFAATAYTYNIEKIKEYEGVKGVFEDTCYTVPETKEADSFAKIFALRRGYLGEGALVAVADSSFNINHSAFRLSDETTALYDKTDIEKIITGNTLQAELLSPSLTADGVYKSAKVPFAFDYSSNDTNVYSSESHGNGVASVIGGNSSVAKGVLPETQLALMKVATDSGVIKASSILSAFEDAVILGADAINLSIGASAGFSSGELEGLDFGTLFENIRNRGIFVSCACGNDCMVNGEGLSKVNYGGSMPRTANPDYGIICTPATAEDSVAVAAYDPKTGLPAYYSSAGPNPNLLLKPDITAKGTHYLASLSGYATRSGTSFASPELCAKSVIVSKELEARGVEKSRLSRLAENVMMSSADVITYSNGIPVSPRFQGSGYVNTDRALGIKTVLYGEDGKGKLSLGDKLTNSINISFYAENMTNEKVSYTPSIQVVTDGYSNGRITGKSVGVPHTASFDETLISLNAGERKKINVNIEIDEEWAEENSSVFVNGFYIEGYIFLESSEDTVNIPFMGFCGDWTKPPVFIPLSSENGFGFGEIFGSNARSPKNLFYLGNKYFKGNINLSVKDYNKIAFSPNSDGVFDAAKLYMGLYRNALKLRWEIRTEEGERIKSVGVLNIGKGTGIGYFGSAYFKWDGKNSSGKLMPDGRYYLCAEAYLDFGEDVVSDRIRYPIYLDTTAPQMTEFSVEEINGKEILSYNAIDGNFVQIGALSDLKGNVLAMDVDTEDGKYSFDITGFPQKLLAEVADYGLNMSGAVVERGDEYKAFFSGDGILMRVEKSKGLVVNGNGAEDYENTVFGDDEEYMKVFIWNENMNPIFKSVVNNRRR